jgi:energy-coupling factor transporter ATP-binding protein EcfA2
MKINKIKINNFGNLSDKNIEFKKFNIIYGKNESGKSTLQSYIVSALYGIQKTKNGKAMSDFDKYEPWNGGEFSGTINYALDNGDEYNVFRNFKNNKVELTDATGKDVSGNYSIDKKLGNNFFTEQVNLDRSLVETTAFAEQKGIEISQDSQNVLIQKIANLAESGDEDVSYKKAESNIKKMITEKVGTNQTSERPINIVKKNIDLYENKIKEIESITSKKFELETARNEIAEQLNEEKNNESQFEKIKEAVDYNNKEETKIKPYEDMLVKKQAELKKVSSKVKTTKSEKKVECNAENKAKKSGRLSIIIALVLLVASIVGIVLSIGKNDTATRICGAATLVMTVVTAFLAVKTRQEKEVIKTKNEEDEIEDAEENDNNLLINQIENEIAELEETINSMKKKLVEDNNKNKEWIIKEYGKECEVFFNKDIDTYVKNNKNNIRNLELDLHKKELELQNIEPQLEKLAEYEERLAVEKEAYEELLEKKRIYDMTLELLRDSYEEMKANITPEYNKKVSKMIEIFSDGKYKNVSITDGINVELENGQRVEANKLSVGTIEQIYLAIRLSIINELSEESFPIILDEPFAYSDNNRLSDMMQFLAKVENQVIVLTCTEREKDEAVKLNIDYNWIEM